MSQNPSPKTKKYGGGGNNCKEDDKNHGQDKEKRHQGEYEEEVEEEDEEAVITCLQQEIESCRNQTRVAIKSSWKEVEVNVLDLSTSSASPTFYPFCLTYSPMVTSE